MDIIKTMALSSLFFLITAVATFVGEMYLYALLSIISALCFGISSASLYRKVKNAEREAKKNAGVLDV